jgi:hypothetical protein
MCQHMSISHVVQRTAFGADDGRNVHVGDQYGTVQSSADVYSQSESRDRGEPEVKEKKGRFDHPVN